MLLVGDPGIGKTRIARELAFRAAALGVAVRWVRCQETEAHRPTGRGCRSSALASGSSRSLTRTTPRRLALTGPREPSYRDP